MKEFIDKLKTKLIYKGEELEKLASECKLDKEDIASKNGYHVAISHAIEIVNQLAEEYNTKQEHEVWLKGCDDDTIFTMEMTNNEYEFLKRVSELANETSTYGCMPRLYLDEGVWYTPSYTEGE